MRGNHKFSWFLREHNSATPGITTTYQQTRVEIRMMFFEKVDTAVIDFAALPWVPFLPYSDKVFVKAIKVDPIRGEWITLLKVPADV